MSVTLTFKCPRCRYRCDAATPVSAKDGARVTPQPGDLSVCLKCGAPLQFDTGRAPRWLTMEEIANLEPDERGPLVNAMIAVLTVRPGRVRSV